MVEMHKARAALKKCESALLLLSDKNNIDWAPKHLTKEEKAMFYNKAHKKLVKIRKQLTLVDELREGG